jgi:hypothetical protein
MSAEPVSRLAAAIEEIEGMILSRYPGASFAVAEGEDPDGTYLTATVDVEDTDEVFDVVVERLLQMQVEEGIPLHVLTVRPIERVLAELYVRRPAWERPIPSME